MSLRLAVVLLVALSATDSAAQPVAFEFSFWPGKSAQRDPRFLRLLEHPCGQVAVARVTILPGVKETGALIAEQVLEVNAQDQIVRRWRVPVDSYPLALRGGHLIFQGGLATYRVDQQGRVSRYPGPRPKRPSPRKSCPGGAYFPGSAYAVCQTLTDLTTGQPRRIRFEAPCT